MQPLTDDIAEWCDDTWGQSPTEVLEWFEDDEIADAMNCSIKGVKDLFNAIKEKYQQPKIPQRVYLNKRKELFPELFADHSC